MDFFSNDGARSRRIASACMLERVLVRMISDFVQRCDQISQLAELLQVALSNEPFNIALPHEKLTVFGQVDCAAKAVVHEH